MGEFRFCSDFPTERPKFQRRKDMVGEVVIREAGQDLGGGFEGSTGFPACRSPGSAVSVFVV